MQRPHAARRTDGFNSMQEGLGLLSIQLIPCKLTDREIEARLASGLVVLPGQLVRLETKTPVYGRVQEVRTPSEDGKRTPAEPVLHISVLWGTPTLAPVQMTLLTPGQMTREIARLQSPPEQPLPFGDVFQAEFFRLGALTLVHGNDFVLKYSALLGLIEAVKAYQRILIIDPLGVFDGGDIFPCFKAGEDVRLSIRQISGQRFFDTFGTLFPESVRNQTMQTVASHWPEGDAFTGFSPLLTTGMVLSSPMKNLILQNCAGVIRNKLFAESPDQVLNLARVTQKPVSVLDLSLLQEPWRGFFYQEVMAQLFANPNEGIVPVLIYPENYLPDLQAWVRKADESERHLLALVSPYAPPTLFELANNTLHAESGSAITLQGQMTLNLPVAYPLPGHSEVQVQPEEKLETAQSVQPAAPFFTQSPEPQETHPEGQDSFLDEADTEVASDWEAETDEPFLIDSDEQALAQSENPEPQAFFSSWQQKVDEDFESTEPEALSLAESMAAKPPPLDLSAPVIDLSAPSKEILPSFLTAEQLSELLSPSSAPMREEIESEPVMADSLDYADAEEGAVPVEMGSSTNFPGFLQQEHATPAFDIPTEAATPWLEPVSAAPPFPTPEEFEKDEFSFDVNLDQKPEPAYEQSFGTAASGLSEAHYATAAPQVEAFQPLPSPMPELSVTGHGWQEIPAESHFSSFQTEGAFWEEPAVELQATANSGPETNVDSDTLDLLFPRRFDAPDEAPALSVSPESAPTDEAPVPVIQKKAEIPASGIPAYKAGDKVRHANYGMGIVQKVIPLDASVVLNVTFEKVGKRLLDPTLTDLVLEPAG